MHLVLSLPAEVDKHSQKSKRNIRRSAALCISFPGCTLYRQPISFSRYSLDKPGATRASHATDVAVLSNSQTALFLAAVVRAVLMSSRSYRGGKPCCCPGKCTCGWYVSGAWKVLAREVCLCRWSARSLILRMWSCGKHRMWEGAQELRDDSGGRIAWVF